MSFDGCGGPRHRGGIPYLRLQLPLTETGIGKAIRERAALNWVESDLE